MKVEPIASAHPARYTAVTAPAAGPSRRQAVAGSGRHSQNSRARARLALSTNVARSAAGGTTRASARLNRRRAITVCWTANSASSPASAAAAAGQAQAGPSSIPFGTAVPARNPAAYTVTAKNAR
jgi:hypothetical protein